AANRSSRRATVARCSSAESTTSSRRRRRISSSVIAGALQGLMQRLLVAFQDRDGFLEDRLALLRLGDDVEHTADPAREEDSREAREDRGPVLLRRPEGEGEDREEDAERDEVERGDADHEESH